MSNEIAEFTTANAPAAFSSIRGGDMETRKQVFKALSNATPLADHLGKTIPVVHIVQMPVESVNEATGELDKYLRTTIIDAKGNAYAASSKGIDNSVALILATLGDPARWDEPVPMVASKGGQGTRQYLTLALA